MRVESVKVRHRVHCGCDVTEIIVVADGRSYLTMQGGRQTLSEGYQKAAFEARHKPGFYRVQG